MTIKGALGRLSVALAAFSITMPTQAAITIYGGPIFNYVAASSAIESLYSGNYAPITPPPQVSFPLSAVAGNSASSTFFGSSVTGETISFDWNFVHARDGSEYSYAESNFSMFFSVDTDSVYSISGLYELSGSNSIAQTVKLYDHSTSSVLLHSYVLSLTAPDEVLEVGQPSGEYNTIEGSNTGVLLAGDLYEFQYDYMLLAYAAFGNEDASAVGSLNLTISASATVPEPASIAIWGFAAIGCASAACRRRKGLPSQKSCQEEFFFQ